MPHHLKKLTPNLVVADVDRSVAFYRDLLGFAVNSTVPEASPYVFAIVKSGGVEIYLNAPGPAHEEYPAFKGRPIGGTLTLFIDVDDIRGAYAELKGRVEVVMPLEKKWYGVTEFAFLDPDSYIITFAQVESGA
jgi:catechol 2,3-dioxygenase-like lactoylglutathione lyase family enzyme